MDRPLRRDHALALPEDDGDAMTDQIVVDHASKWFGDLVAVSERGTPSIFARNAVSASEFTGVNFSPDRNTLFANIQDEGYVFAITGPFARLRRM